MDVLDLLDEAEREFSSRTGPCVPDDPDVNGDEFCKVCGHEVRHRSAICRPSEKLDGLSRTHIRALIDIAKAARDIRSDIARTVDLSLDWSYDPGRETSAISTIVDSNHLMAFVKALTKFGNGDG